MKSVGIIIEGFTFPLGANEDIDVIYDRLIQCKKDGKRFGFKNITGEQHWIPPWALDKVNAVIEGSAPSSAPSTDPPPGTIPILRKLQ